MDRNNWGRINELFEAARRLPVEERGAWVRGATADERTRAEVLSLLHAHEDDPWFVEEPFRSGVTPSGLRPTPLGSPPTPSAARPAPQGSWPAHSAPRPTPPSSWPAPPASRPALQARFAEVPAGGLFASYRTVREIGRGSTGVVYEAVGERQGHHPRVTLRLLPREWSTPGLVDRFFAESNLLARLDHPWIARLVDGGVADDGTPYLVMEQVAGEAIDTWCRNRKLDEHDRVKLVLRVCAALEHAHQRLVLHRDLSPRNIVVTADGQPKLLNCGIAQLRIDEPDSGEGSTGTDHSLFTPEYASPEQIRGEPLTTASDVYSLGVLLYVLLTDHPPYEVGGLSPRQMRETICHAEPTLPSRVMAIDLDHVLLKALRKDPNARYHSVTALASDLRAWLDGRPVSAGHATRWYRVRKFVRRHQVAAAVGAAIVLAIAGGVAAMGWQAYEARLGLDTAESRLREVLRSSRLSQLELHDSIRTLPGSTAARRLLLGHATDTMDALAKDAGGNRAIGLELAAGYLSLGQLQESSAGEIPDIRAAALKSYERAATFGEQVLVAEPRSIDAAILLTGAYDALANTRLKAGDGDGADRADARHLALVDLLAREYPLDPRARVVVASGYGRLAFFRAAREDWTAAKTRYGSAIAAFERLAAEGAIPDEALRDYSRARQQLGAILLQDGALDEAERLYLSAQAIDKDLAARRPQDLALRYEMAGSVNALALIARRGGNVTKAESLWTQALTAMQAALDADPKDTRALVGLADVRMSLASVCRSQRRFEEAILHVREGVRARARVAGPDASRPDASAALASARVYLARALLDLVEVRPPAPTDAARLREAGALLAQAWPVARGAGASSAAQQDTLAEIERQTARLRRLTSERR
jgi:non-specific serine/threonine protein kinase/serine/threonine-protein kinase